MHTKQTFTLVYIRHVPLGLGYVSTDKSGTQDYQLSAQHLAVIKNITPFL